jgi:imidazolonepropionase-like amidohydrolase
MTLSTLIYNASIWQWKDARSYSEDSEELGFAVQNYFITTEGGFIKYVSAPNEEPPAKESFEVVVNAQGRLVLPGLIGNICNLLHLIARST